MQNVRLYAKHFRRDLVASPEGLPEAARERLLLQGANGSGKSTFLETVATLWGYFGDWIDMGPGRTASRRYLRRLRQYLLEGDLAAVEIGGLLPNKRSLWIGIGKVGDWVDLKEQRPEAEFAGLICSKSGWEIQLPAGDWGNFRQLSLVGSEPRANVVFFPPEHRTTGPEAGMAPRIVDLIPYSWLATYSESVHIASLLLTIRAKSAGVYDEAMRHINQALDKQGKEITELSPNGMIVECRLGVEVKSKHPIGALSSGEKQMVLLIGFLAATLREGGIVLIDEPDLHIHVTMLQQLLGAIEAIVKQRHGQLIVASHSEEVWDWFSLSSEQIELASWRRATT